MLVWGDSVLGHTIGTIELLGMNNSGQMLLRVEAQGPDTWHALVVATAVSPPDLPGDYNDDGKVDAADYVVWRKHEGSMTTLPNDPHGGTIGTLQFSTWRANFSNMAGSGSGAESANAAVPEPTALVLLVVAIAGGIIQRHRP